MSNMQIHRFIAQSTTLNQLTQDIEGYYLNEWQKQLVKTDELIKKNKKLYRLEAITVGVGAVAAGGVSIFGGAFAKTDSLQKTVQAISQGITQAGQIPLALEHGEQATAQSLQRLEEMELSHTKELDGKTARSEQERMESLSKCIDAVQRSYQKGG